MEMTMENKNKIVHYLYEKCANGEISIDQREALIRKTNSMFTATESVTNVENVNPLHKLKYSPKSKYEMVKKMVYEKCANGEITEVQRELLLEKAHDEFLNIS